MPAYRFRDPSPVFFNLLGTGSIPGGSWQFYELNTTTPKDTWADPALTTLNPNPVPLDASGRFTVPVWLDGDYTVVAYDAGGNVIVPATPLIPEVAPGLAIPDLSGNGGKFLTNDGSNLAWASLLQLPDPSGSAGYVVVANSAGDGYILQSPPAPPAPPPDPDIDVGSTSLTVGDGGEEKFLIQLGTDTAPASGNYYTQKSVTFPIPFTKLLGVAPTLLTTVVGVQTGIPAFAVTGWTFGAPSTAVNFYLRNIPVGEHDDSNDYITQSVPFSWIAFGLVAAE